MHTLNISKFKVYLSWKEKDPVPRRYLLIFILSSFFNFLVQHSFKHNNLLKRASGESARYNTKI